MNFIFKKLSIPEVILIEPKLFFDERGFFFENFKEKDFISNGITKFIQENFSHSIQGVIRGLHYQKNPKSQAKLVTVLSGEIFDVAVDIRKKSPTYGKFVTEILSENNHRSLYIPEGFAHGFSVLSKNANIIYKISNDYSPNDEGGIIWNDPVLNIPWPIKNPIISEKDSKLPLLEKIENNFN
jgi:dTDP-4-dehydrorhamnose 3,5-epimerase|tara:strand:- start:2814 stop:3362 length:549 start_codon:yes stop_codon:yes gene_type:complete